MSQPKGYVDADYLDTTTRLMAPSKRRSYELMHLEPGHRVLDVGCGPGSDTLAISNLVGPAGEGYDPVADLRMLEKLWLEKLGRRGERGYR
jgi:ubiquinone/menaquinone biosynthesis C-methylase UbiE